MQTSYTNLAPDGLLGLMTEDFTRYVDTTVPGVSVKIGKMLCVDKTAGKPRGAAKLPAAATDVTSKYNLYGVVPWDQSREGGVDWPASRPTPVLRRGRIWVLAESNVLRFTPAFVRYAAGAGGTEIGSFRADVDTASAAQCDWAMWITDATAGSLALLEVSIF